MVPDPKTKKGKIELENETKNETEVKYFSVRHIQPDFKSIDVEKEEFQYSNGEITLLEGGRIFARDPRLESENLMIEARFELSFFRCDPNNEKDVWNLLQEDIPDLLYNSFGFVIEGCDVVFFGDKELEGMYSDPHYLRTVGKESDELRTEIADLKYQLEWFERRQLRLLQPKNLPSYQKWIADLKYQLEWLERRQLRVLQLEELEDWEVA